ncbi:MAG: leucine-rich repeat domain-containing protein [Firmicutes bacterium]|nr:leucine-rich repeat domain-containing protein [Bacillota bacterium]
MKNNSFNKNKKSQKQNAKRIFPKRKILGILLVMALIVSSIFLLTACGRETLATPTNIHINRETRELTWDQVDYSTGGYNVEILHIEQNTSNIHHTYYNGLTLPGNLPVGTHRIRVQALTRETRNYFRNSGWSVAEYFIVDDPGVLRFRRINNYTEYEVFGRVLETQPPPSHIIIPDYFNGLPVTRIARRALDSMLTLQSVVIGNNIRYIEELAFNANSRLTSITFGNSVEYIGRRAFAFNSDNNILELPDSLIHIGIEAFLSNGALSQLTFGSSLQSIGDSAFRGSTRLRNITFPDSLKHIGSQAFASGTANLTQLETVNFGSGIETIDDSAFLRSGITTLNLDGSGNTVIGPLAFSETRNLGAVILGNGVERIMPGAFFRSSLTSLDFIGNGLAVIEGSRLRTNDNGSVVRIGGRGAFEETRSLTTVNIGIGVSVIQMFAFLDSGLQVGQVNLGTGVSRIERWAFSGTPYFSSQQGEIYIDNWLVDYIRASRPPVGENPPSPLPPPPERYLRIRTGTRGVAEHALDNRHHSFRNRLGWNNLNNITKIYIPSSLEHINLEAFVSMRGVVEVEFFDGTSNLLTIANSVFANNVELRNITLPDSLISVGMRILNNTHLVNNWDHEEYGRVVYSGRWAVGYRAPPSDSTAPHIITLRPNTLGIADFNFDRSSASAFNLNQGLKFVGRFSFRQAENFTSINIPDSVERIGEGAFLRAEGLRTISLGTGITEIEDYTFFRATGLSSIIIPNNVTSIGAQAFYMATGLMNITFSDALIHIGESAFRNNSAIMTLNLPNSLISIGDNAFRNSMNITTINFGNSLEFIGDNAFRGLAFLQELNLPHSLTHIGNQAFMELRSITELTINSNIQYIGFEAFRDLSNLETLIIEEGLTHISTGAFFGATSLNSVVIPSSVIYIGRYAFRNLTTLKSIIIPITVLSMRDHVFFGGNENLIVFVEAPSPLGDWNVYWNSTDLYVIWNYGRAS